MIRSLVTVLALLILGACSSSNPAGQSDGDEPTPPPTTGAEAAAFLESLREGFSDAPFEITYRISSTGQAEDAEITWAQDPPRSSYRFTAGGSGTLIIDPGDGSGSISCSGDQCVRFPDEGQIPAAAFLAPLFAFRDAIAEADDLPGFASTGDATIAGRSAQCASWTFTGTAQACVDAELGLLLRWSASFQGQETSFEAIEFGEPSDDDFEPTGEVQDFPS